MARSPEKHPEVRRPPHNQTEATALAAAVVEDEAEAIHGLGGSGHEGGRDPTKESGAWGPDV